MARSNNSFIKKQKADKKAKIRKEKLQKRIEKTKNSSSTNLESMIAYVDKFGNILSEPPVDSDSKIDNNNIQN
jgi:hypothetical protein